MTHRIDNSAGSANGVSRRSPDFFIVGHPKCGTTALYQMLLQHELIYMPRLKEPMFFSTDLAHIYQSEMLGPLPVTLPDYLELFSPAADRQLAGEASSFYLLSRVAARGISEVNPDARIIAIFREPASFLRSFHVELLKHHVEDQTSLRRALELESERLSGRRIPKRASRPPLLLYSDHVAYVDQLRRYHDAFGRERVHMVVYDDFANDNLGTVRQILDFLGLAADGMAIDAVQSNRTEQVTKHQSLDNAVRRVSVGYGRPARLTKAALKTFIPRSTRRRLLEFVSSNVVRGAPEPPDEVLMREIRLRFRPQVEAFGEYIGRDLTDLWGT